MASLSELEPELPPLTREPLRWGVLGAARVARKVLPALRAAGGEVIAVGASAHDRAAAFARELEIPQAYGDYASVLEHDEIDAIYLPLANHLHFRWALEAARAGKHCLVEKPLTASADEADQLHHAFRAAGRRLMEGFMWRHTPRSAWLLRQIENEELGELRRVLVNFSFNFDRPHDYRWRDEAGGGALMDIGCYAVNAARFFFGVEPQRVSAGAVPVHPGSVADRSVAAWADFGDDRLLSFTCSFSSFYTQELLLIGTLGTMRVAQPFSGGDRVEVTLLPADQGYEKLFAPANPFTWMGAHFMRAARDSSLSLLPGEDGLAQARAMEALVQSVRENGAAVQVEV